MSLSYKEKLELIIFGYVRLNYNDRFPNDINGLCLEYYDKIEIVWDVFRDELADHVSSDGLEVRLSSSQNTYSTFASSMGWNKGIHCYTIEQLDSTNCIGIGVLSSEGIQAIAGEGYKDYFMFPKQNDAIGYSLDYKSIFTLREDSFQFKMSSNSKAVSKGDKVTIVVDCDEWRITFYVNDKVCNKSMSLVEDKVYHPTFTVWGGCSVSIRLIDTSWIYYQ